MIIEQKIREIFVECAMRGKLCPRPEDCQDISCSECKIDLILGLLEPQQPAEGELVSMDITDNIIVEELGSAVERIRNIIRRVKEAQLDHVLAQGYVRLPSAKRAADIVEALDKEFPPLSDTRLAGLELIKLLKGEAKQ